MLDEVLIDGRRVAALSHSATMNGRHDSQALRDLPESVATLNSVAGFGSYP
jgi:hypothetical protein